MRKLRWILLAVLLLLAGGGAAYYWLSPPAKLALKLVSAQKADLDRAGNQPQAQEITYNHVEDGRRKWGLVADSGEYDPQSGNISLQKVKLTFYQENGGTLYIEGDTGTYDQNTQQVELTGNVFGRNSQNVTLRTSRLLYSEKTRMVETEREVTVAGPTFSITSLGMKAFPDPQRVFFEQRVNSTFWPGESGQGQVRDTPA